MTKTEAWKVNFQPNWKDKALFVWCLANVIAAALSAPMFYWDLNW